MDPETSSEPALNLIGGRQGECGPGSFPAYSHIWQSPSFVDNLRHNNDLEALTFKSQFPADRKKQKLNEVF